VRKESERFKCFPYKDLLKRDKVNLDIFWLKDESLEDSANLPASDVIAADIAEDLQTAHPSCKQQLLLGDQDLSSARHVSGFRSLLLHHAIITLQ
jgi:hypothetical protein